MELRAKAKYLSTSARKARLVIDLVRGLDAAEAQHQLKFIAKKAAKPILKLLNSAIANAEHNHSLEKENLYIAKIAADEAPTLKRWTAKAFGRSAPIRKRRCHITIVLGEKAGTEKEPVAKAKEKKLEEPKIVRSVPKERDVAGQERAPEEKLPPKETKEGKKAEAFDARERGKHRNAQHTDSIRSKEKGGKNVIKKIFRRKSA